VTARSEESQDHRQTGTARDDPGVGGPETEAEAKAADRVIFFSDAVIAIAITLLALALPVPDLKGNATNGQYWHALTAEHTDYLTFLVSFAVIGNHWVTHRRVFRYVRRVDGRVGRLNMIWLLMMIFTPVASRIVSVGDGAGGVRSAIYAAVQIIATACLLEMSRELRRRGMLSPDSPESARRPDAAPYLAVILAFAVSIPVAFFTGWAWVFWALSPLLATVTSRLTAGWRPTAPRPG
jgi:uncharacterized membrane protein